ncbi:MAG: flagellar assembly protein FliW [Oscillospiraceae bacterium]|nr:flagellar assembly protein FliW [Oscillospiraceae bacterium]
MLLQTKYFGQVDCPAEHVLHFAGGLFGFEDEKEFALLPFEGGGGSLLCFQSASTPQLAFVAVNPFSLKPDYAPVLTKAELAELGVERSEDLCFYALCVVRDPVGESTVNLRCPLAVNDRTCQAMQVILDGGAYHMRHSLAELNAGKEEAPC